jgi:hypothetical protein
VVNLIAIEIKPDTIGSEAVILKLRNRRAGIGQVGKLAATIKRGFYNPLGATLELLIEKLNKGRAIFPEAQAHLYL